MNLCIQVLYVINARIRIVQNFVDRPSASTSSARSQGAFVPLYKPVIRAKIYGKLGNLAIWFYKQRYAERYETSSKENNPAIGSFLWVVMLIMIMKPHLQSMWEENIEDLVRGKFPNSMVFNEPKISLPSLPTEYSLKNASLRLHPV